MVVIPLGGLAGGYYLLPGKPPVPAADGGAGGKKALPLPPGQVKLDTLRRHRAQGQRRPGGQGDGRRGARDGTLRPGLFVTAEVTTHEERAPVAVRAEAVQTVDGKPSVFVRGGRMSSRHVPSASGARTGDFQEITRGLRAGETYAATHSFVLKTELGKGAPGDD